MALTLNDLLRQAGVDPSGVVAFRHRPPEAALARALPALAAEQPQVFEAYQAIQAPPAAAMLRRASHLASFIGQEPGRATFAGLWSVGEGVSVTAQEAAALPYMSELADLGMAPTPEGSALDTRFALERHDAYAEWAGRLVVAWPARGINWKLRAANHDIVVHAITEESRFLGAMPDWRDLSVAWRELRSWPSSWRDRLQGWRGVYYVFDEARRQGYVGSAGGEDNLLGRWSDYDVAGDAGNVRLRGYDPQALRFSILELTSPSLGLKELVRLETSWKARLRTREHGLNAA